MAHSISIFNTATVWNDVVEENNPKRPTKPWFQMLNSCFVGFPAAQSQSERAGLAHRAAIKNNGYCV